MAVDNIVEGMSNDVLLVILGLFVMLSAFIYSLWKSLRDEYSDDSEDTSSANADAPPVHNPNICPICWNVQTLALETNCGHLYCGSCIMSFHDTDTNSSLHGIKCPMCRSPVTLLFKCFTTQEKEADNASEIGVLRLRVRQFARTYNRIHSDGQRTMLDHMREIPVLLRHLYHEIQETGFGDFYLNVRLYLIMFLSVMYVLIPSDILPERVFGLVGFFDDIVLLMIFSCYVASIYRQYLGGGDDVGQ